MYLVFYKTSDVFAAEEILQNSEIKTEVTPTPVQDKAYCGVCLKVFPDVWEKVKLLLNDFEYQSVES